MAEERPAPTAPHGAGIRRRLIAVAAVVVVVAVSGAGLDHVLGPRTAAAGDASGAATGAWFCPHGGSSGWSGWVVMGNPGTSTVRVRLTELTTGRLPSVTSFSVGPLQQVYREVSAIDPSDATVVEYFGGWIGAAAVVASEQSGVGAERCEPFSRRTWYLLDEPTGPGETSYVVVMNPFAEDAAFDLVARTETRTIAPGPLRPYVLPARSSVAFRLNDIALEGPGERTVSVTVVQRVGRVIAGGLSTTPRGLRLGAGAILSGMTDIPAGGYAGPAALILANPGANRADLSVIGSGRTGQRVVSGPDGISLAPGEVRTIEVAGLTGGAVVHSDNGQPALAVLRVAGGPRGDQVTVTGTPTPERAWLVLPALTPRGGRSFLVLQNPGRSGLRINVQLLGPSGVVPAPRLSSISLPPGRTISVPIPASSRPVTALVRAQGGTLVAGAASYPAGGGYAGILGLPM